MSAKPRSPKRRPRNPAVAARKLERARQIARRCAEVDGKHPVPAWVRHQLEKAKEARAA